MPADWLTDPVLLVLNAGAVFRLTRLLIRDSLPGLATVRDHLLDRGRPRWLVELLGCAWCTSVWVAGAVVGLHALAPGVWPYAAAVLTFSAAAGLVDEWTERG